MTAGRVTFQAAVAVTVGSTGIVVPEKAIEQLAAGKRPPVLVTVNGYEYRNTVVSAAKRTNENLT